MKINKREFLAYSGMALLFAKVAQAATDGSASAPEVCLARQQEVTVESSESPFFQHFHQLSIPVAALLKQPKEGVVVKTSPIDLKSYDVEGFKKFVASSSLKAEDLLSHSHEVTLTKADLNRIASGEKDVEIRVVSANGNYVHNFLITASPSTLAKVRRYQQGKLKI